MLIYFFSESAPTARLKILAFLSLNSEKLCSETASRMICLHVRHNHKDVGHCSIFLRGYNYSYTALLNAKGRKSRRKT